MLRRMKSASDGRLKFFPVLSLFLLSVIGCQLLVSQAYAVLSCTSCHGYPPSYTSKITKGNSHGKHPTTCETCHIEVTTAAYTITYSTNHVNGVYNLNASLGYDSATSSCATPGCHTKTYWGGPSLKCADCHMVNAVDVDDYLYTDGVVTSTKATISSSTTTGWYGAGHGRKTASGNYSDSGRPAANLINAAGTDGTGCAYCHDYLNTSHTDSRSGFFRLYVSSDNTICNKCHLVGSAGFNPPDTTAEGTLDLKNHVSATTVAATCTGHVTNAHGTEGTYSDGGYFCWDCHDPHGDNGVKTALPLAYMIQARPSELTEGTVAGSRYGVPRSTTITTITISSFTKTGGKDANNIDVADYAFTLSSGVCQVCHDGAGGADVNHYDQKTFDGHKMTETGRCTKSGCHEHDGDFKVEGTCVGCHGGVQSGTVSRRAIVPEFSNTWSHMHSSSQTNKVTNLDCCVCHTEGDLATTNTNATYHGNDGGYKTIDLRQPDTGAVISSAPVKFTRNTASSSLEVWVSSVQNQFCFGCHDDNGANSSGARIRSQWQPFNSTGTLSLLPAGTASAIGNTYNQFNSTYASYHPVRSVQNNSYCNANTMVTPWNSATHKCISCWDCHIQTATAHGGNMTLRASYSPTTLALDDPGTPLCLLCHLDTVYVLTADLTVSAFQSSSAGTEDHQVNHYARGLADCGSCHGSGWGTYTDRRVRGQNAHGFDTLVAGGNWSSGSRPYAFMRNTTNFPNTGSWAAGSCAGVATSAGCDDRGHVSGGYTYTPGGTY